MRAERIIGIDPGYATLGWGILDFSGSRFKVVDYGAIITEPDLVFSRRIEIIYEQLTAILDKHSPTGMGIEKLYFTKNVTTGIDVAQARGVVLLAAQQHSLRLGEYTPMQVKQAVVGYGNAEKAQIMYMTKTLLNLPALPKPDDVADALAVAICHAHSKTSQLTIDN
ncbi:MAG: crossover junction endodeoxyribonuclease RuvC [Oscillospiraceae bacterium]|nr:crossover junction endodeoxyribonuclease RuvC [Oscillospiraceae bacterium]